MPGRKVIVVGGGYAGTAAAKRLDPVTDVTLVDRKEVFFHRPASLRAAVDPAWTQAPFMRYDALLSRGRVVVAEVVDLQVDDHRVRLASGEELPYDALVLATGAAYPEPARFAGRTVEDAAKALRLHQERIAAAGHVLVIGGGPAGVELSAEIAIAHPEHQVTLAHAGSTLLSGHSAKLGRRAEARLRAHGVDVRLDTRLRPSIPGGSWTTPDDSFTVNPDLVFTATGTTPETSWIAARHPDWLDSTGRLRVDPQLRIGGRPDVFAVGDVTDVAEPKLAQYAAAQGKEAAAGVLALLDGGTSPKPHKPVTSDVIMVPMGARDGVGLLPGGIVVGPRVTAAIKSRALFVPYFRKALNLPKSEK